METLQQHTKPIKSSVPNSRHFHAHLAIHTFVRSFECCYFSVFTKQRLHSHLGCVGLVLNFVYSGGSEQRQETVDDPKPRFCHRASIHPSPWASSRAPPRPRPQDGAWRGDARAPRRPRPLRPRDQGPRQAARGGEPQEGWRGPPDVGVFGAGGDRDSD